MEVVKEREQARVRECAHRAHLCLVVALTAALLEARIRVAAAAMKSRRAR
jgi:hypothetical protein